MTIPIQPIPCFPAPAVTLQIEDGRVNLGSGANFQWSLISEDNIVVAGPGRASLTDEQYSDWTGDDIFVAQCIAKNLGLTPI